MVEIAERGRDGKESNFHVLQTISLSLNLSHALTLESTNGGGDDLSPSFVQQYPLQHGHQLNEVEVVQLTVTIL